MRNMILLLLGITFSSQLAAQPDNWFFSIAMGTSLPQGTFKQRNTLDEKAGFAENGFTLSLDANYPIGDNWAIKGMVMLNSNPVNRSGMGTMMESRMNKYFAVTDENRDNLSLTANSWLTNNMLFGPVFTINFDKIYWDFQALGGLNVTYLPQQKLKYENPKVNWLYVQQNTTSTSVSYGILAGTALRFAISENVNLRVAVDYLWSEATIKYEELRFTKEGEIINIETLNSGKTKNPIESISGTIGFVYYL